MPPAALSLPRAPPPVAVAAARRPHAASSAVSRPRIIVSSHHHHRAPRGLRPQLPARRRAGGGCGRERCLRLEATAFLSPEAAMAGLALALGGMVVAAVSRARSLAARPEVLYSRTPFNDRVMQRCTSASEEYKPFPGLTNPHVETILASLLRSNPDVKFRRECLLMDDGGCVALDWPMSVEGKLAEEWPELPSDAPVFVLFPGLTGGSHDTYPRHLLCRLRRSGYRAVVFNSRATSDSPVTTPQFYSASFTGDSRAVVQHVRDLYPRSHIFGAGWSLGANIMLRYLGEAGEHSHMSAAISMCNPFNLEVSNANLKVGFNNFYDWNLAQSLKKILGGHDKIFNAYRGKYDLSKIKNQKTIREFDEGITHISFGWESVDEYYAGSGSCYSVPHLQVPTLCIQAADDPIAPANAIPYAELEANDKCALVVTPTGGHLGWCSGEDAPFGAPWTDTLCLEYIKAIEVELGPYQEPEAARGWGRGPGPGLGARARAGVQYNR